MPSTEEREAQPVLEEPCPKCGFPVVLRSWKGRFFTKCKNTGCAFGYDADNRGNPASRCAACGTGRMRTADNLAQKELTEVYAKDIDNVKSVKNDIVVVAPAAGSTVGETIDDASITSQVKYALLSHRATSALSTKVITDGAVVSITGVASSDAEKDLVTKLAQDTRGVKSVVNDMTVKS